MITMMQFDSVQNPVQPNSKRAASIINQAQNYLEQHPYEEFDKDELEKVNF